MLVYKSAIASCDAQHIVMILLHPALSEIGSALRSKLIVENRPAKPRLLAHWKPWVRGDGMAMDMHDPPR